MIKTGTELEKAVCEFGGWLNGCYETEVAKGTDEYDSFYINKLGRVIEVFKALTSEGKEHEQVSREENSI